MSFVTSSTNLTQNTFQVQTAQQISGSTRYDQLQPDMQQKLTGLHKQLSEYWEISDEIAHVRSSTDVVDQVSVEIESVLEKTTLLRTELEVHLARITSLHQSTNAATQHASMGLNQLNTPFLTAGDTFPSLFFEQLLKEFESRLKEYRQALNNLEKLVHTNGHTNYTSKNTLHSQHNFSVALAAQLATLKDTVEDLKQDYISYRRKQSRGKPLRTMDEVDPFQPPKAKKSSSFTPQSLVNMPPVTQPNNTNTGNTSFGFGGATNTGNTQTGFSLGGSSFGSGTAGFSFGGTPSAAGGSGGFSSGGTGTGTGTGGTGGFSFGGTGTGTGGTGGFSFGGTSGAATGQPAGGTGGFSFGGNTQPQGGSTGGFTFGAPTGF